MWCTTSSPEKLQPHFDQFEAAYPRVSNRSGNFPKAIAALLEEVGPAILLAHSAGGPSAVSAAKAHPDLVSGIVLIEPTGPPAESDFPVLAGKSMLGVYGDYIDSRRQGGRKEATTTAAGLFSQHDGQGVILDLVEDHAIRGNSHLLMQDNNHDLIAAKILGWIALHADPNPTAEGGRVAIGGGRGAAVGRGRGGRAGGEAAPMRRGRGGEAGNPAGGARLRRAGNG